MKKKFLILALAVFTVVGFSGCDIAKERIEQLRCEHVMDEGEITLEATCETVGEHVKTCTLCGYVETAYIPAIGHKWVNTNVVSPTCTQIGQMAGIHCATCDEWLVETKEVPATGHYLIVDKGYSSTCTETGLTDGSHCILCDEIITAQKEIPANGHKILTLDGKVATCKETGLTDGQVCETCDVVLVAQEEIPATGHTIVTVAGKVATCKEVGLTDGQVCETCDIVLVAQEEIPVVACVDEDSNGLCDSCNRIITLMEGNHKEADVLIGETVVGNWYRIYRPEEGSSSIVFSSLVLGPFGESRLTVGFHADGSYGVGCVLSEKVYKYNPDMGITIYEHDSYIDIYFSVGVLSAYEMLDGLDYTIEVLNPIDETTTFFSFGYGDCHICKLLPNV